VKLRLLAALTVAFAGSLSLAMPVAAECMSPGPPRSVAGYLGYGFEAIVRTVSDRASGQLPDASPFDYEVTLDVTRVHRGTVPHRLVIDGWSYEVTCDNFHVTRRRSPGTRNSTTDGLREYGLGQDVLVWRHGRTGWRFDSRVVHSHDAANRFIPLSARAATTKAEILALIRGELPDTATADSAPESVPAPIIVALLPLVAALAALLRRRRVIEMSRDQEAISS
jgi:MYXO-CTERM domain-containing protein